MFKRFVYWFRGFRSGHVYPGFVFNRHIGNEYWVKLWPSGQYVRAEQLHIKQGESIILATAVLVVYQAGTFYMQVPVWS